MLTRLCLSTAGTNFTTPYMTASYPSPVPDMPAVCRFGAYIHTSNMCVSSSRSEHLARSGRTDFVILYPADPRFSSKSGFRTNGAAALPSSVTAETVSGEVFESAHHVELTGSTLTAGGVNYPDMWAPAARYQVRQPSRSREISRLRTYSLASVGDVQMAVASTDTGHNNSGLDSTFGINNPDSLIDFGHRAVHLTTVYSKKVLEASLDD